MNIFLVIYPIVWCYFFLKFEKSNFKKIQYVKEKVGSYQCSTDTATPLEKNPPDALNFMASLNTHTWQAQLSTFMVESKQTDAIGKVYCKFLSIYDKIDDLNADNQASVEKVKSLLFCFNQAVCIFGRPRESI